MAEEGMTFIDKMNSALWFYGAGEAVVLKDKDGRIIHGEQDLVDILALKSAQKYKVIDGIDFNEWKISHWPQLLEGARRGWLKNKSAKGQNP